MGGKVKQRVEVDDEIKRLCSLCRMMVAEKAGMHSERPPPSMT